MKFSLVVTSLFIGAVSFIGCGSGSSNTASANNNGIKAVATQVVCDPAPVNIDGDTYDMKYTANGDITAECKSMGGIEYAEYKLKSGVNLLTVTELQRVDSFSGTKNGVTGSSTDTYDYKAGTIHHQENSPDGNYDCIETFVSPLPSTITDASSVDELFSWEGTDRISTTCPTSYYDDNGNNDENFNGSVNGLTNYTVTDSNGKKHYITETVSATIRKK